VLKLENTLGQIVASQETLF